MTVGPRGAAPHLTFFAYLIAVVETLIALALIAGFARKITYSAAIVFSLLIWATAEGFGGPYTSGASDVGTAIIYAVVFAALLALSYYAAVPLQRRLLHREEDQLVVEGRRDAPPRPGPGTGPAPCASATAATEGTTTELRRTA